ncbi:DNA-binding response regulator, LytR/AlgR family [Robiginitalea myxolifaciens]|uniref:DNA-binding response regulator, LytR/AlgR family n=1 Tax=Robiginitalea myxolifaciens TaxID=400055 RepID=A0A1I6HKG8_9FLAO|nr:DNA-binding response regulator, LytR/AlgR family [Robiginitalea myxolifaciens]
MEQLVYKVGSASFKPKKSAFRFGLYVLIIGFFVLQDYISSQIRGTGFYISESLLYNHIWLFVVPLTLLELRLLSYFAYTNPIKRFLFLLLLSSLLVLLHITLFTSFFVSVSYLLWTPSHRFVSIFDSALSSEFSILALYYFFLPRLYKFYTKPIQESEIRAGYARTIRVRSGLKTIVLNPNTIETISTDKPYTFITTPADNFLDNRSLKAFQTILDPAEFVRVNRTTIVNKNCLLELKSRKNGDYDAVLRNKKTIRLSRHYRRNWKTLLQ